MDEDFIMVAVAVCAMVIIGGYILLSKKTGLKPFIPQMLKDTFHNELDAKLESHGTKITGARLCMGINSISFIEYFLELDSVEDKAQYDDVTKNIYAVEIADSDKKSHRFLMLRAKNRKIIFRLLGMRKQYYVISDKDGKNIYTYDPRSKTFTFPYYLDFVPYGEVWVNSDASRNYLHDFSVKRMLEITQMYVENQPDKVIHLEAEASRTERMDRMRMNLEKSRYEDSKYTGDTKIT